LGVDDLSGPSIDVKLKERKKDEEETASPLKIFKDPEPVGFFSFLNF